jgi:hypothetical protein
MPSTFNPRIEATRRVLSRTPAFGMLEIADATGKILNKATGESYDDIQAAVASLSAYKMVDFRRMGAESFSMGQSIGAASTQSELLALNSYLRSASQTDLTDRGLGHLFGQQLDAVYAQYNWGGNAESLKLLTDPTSPHQVKYPGLTAITDEGIMKVSHLISGTETPLTLEQQSVLKSLAGVPTFRKDFVQKFFTDISSGDDAAVADSLGKLPKRQSRILAPREVGFDVTEINNALSTFRTSTGLPGQYALDYNHVDLLLRKAAGDTMLPHEDFLLSFTGGIIRDDIFLSSGEAFEQVAGYAGLTHPLTGVDPDDLASDLKQVLKDALEYRNDTDPSMSLHKAIMENNDIEGLIASTNPREKMFGQMLKNLKDDINPANDGSLKTMSGPLEHMLNGKRSTLNALKSSMALSAPGTINSDQLKEISERQGEIEKIEEAITNASRAENPFTAGTGAGTFKAESGIGKLDIMVNSLKPGSSFTGKDKKLGQSIADQIKDLKATIASASPDEIISLSKRLNNLETLQAGAEYLEQFLIISPTSNLKGEMGSTAGRFITMNISTKHDNDVFLEPMGLLTDPDYYSPQVRQSVQENLARTNASIDSFLNTGIMPQEVLDQIQYEAKALGLVDDNGIRFTTPRIAGTDIEETLLDPTTRGLAKRNRQEMEDILSALESNQDVRKIPAIVNRVKDNSARGAFRIKEGKINLGIPFDKRYDIRTYESALESIPGVEAGGFDVQEVMLKNGTKARIPFIQASYKGDQMMVSGIVASQFKGALSGFDLDDKGVNSLRTFVDGSGKTRIVQVTRRDPKGIEEMLAIRPNLKHAESLQNVIGDNEDALGYFSNFTDEARQKLINKGFSRDEVDSTLEQAKILLGRENGTFSHRTTRGTAHFNSGNELSIIEQMVIEAAESALGPIPEMSDKSLSLMAAVSSASHRGRGAIDPITGRTMQRARNLTSEQGAPYGIRNFTEIFSDPLRTDEVRNETLRLVNEKLPPGQRLTVGQLEPFMKGHLLLPGVTSEKAEHIGGLVIQELSTNSVMKAAMEQKIRNTIGVSSNRGAFVAGSLNMVQDTLENPSILNQFGSLIPAAQQRYGVGTIPPSNIVDMIKQLNGGNQLRPLNEVLGSIENPEEQQIIKSAYESIASVMRRRGTKNRYGGLATADNLSEFEVGDVLEAAIEGAGKFFGWTRGAAIAAGKAEGELPGYDPVAYAERLNIKADRIADQASVISGLEDFLGDSRLSMLQRLRVEAELKRLKELDLPGYEEAISLKAGTPAYEAFAKTALAADDSLKQEAISHSQDVIANNMAARSQRPIAVAEYRDLSRTFLKSPEMSSLFGEMKDIDLALGGETMSSAVQAQRDTIKTEISMRMAESLRAIRDNYSPSSGNVLDIVDTLESEMTSMYGERGRSIFSNLGEKGAEDTMMDIFRLAQERRRLSSQSFDAKHFGLVQQLYQDHVGSGTADLLKVDAEYAANFINFHKTNPSERVDESLLDFMKMVSGSANDRQNMRQRVGETVNEAFGQYYNANRLAEIEAKAGSITASEVFSGPVTDTVAKLKDELGEAVRSMSTTPGNIAKSPYKRVMQSFNHGELGKLLESKNVRRSGVAAIALIGASFLYQRNKKKDLTQGDVAGPPLLPGGSAYDDRPPTRDMALQSAQTQSQGYGMQYQVNTTGSIGDLNNLRSLLGGVVDGPVNSTMYNGMPSLGKDPYSDIASNF